MKKFQKLMLVAALLVLISGAYLLGAMQPVKTAEALDNQGILFSLDWTGAAALSTAAYTTNNSLGYDPELAGQRAAEFYKGFRDAMD